MVEITRKNSRETRVEFTSLAPEFANYEFQRQVFEQRFSFRRRTRLVTPDDLADRSFGKVSPGKGVKVAIAEDERSLLRIISNSLSRSGFIVTLTFRNGRDLTDFVTSNSDPNIEPDVIITDLRMPKMDGLEVAKKIKAAKPQVKIILASAYDVGPEDGKMFDAILRKPFSTNDLVRTISDCFAK